jgi:membrane protein YdbS with pleckstrin-like domain
VKPAAPERVNWWPVAAVFAALLGLILAVALAVGLAHARNWTGVSAVIGVCAALIGAGLVTELAGRRRVRGQR